MSLCNYRQVHYQSGKTPSPLKLSDLIPKFSPCPPLQTFHTPSLGDEEFEIPPITPPPETESGLGLSDVDSPFPAMQEPPVPHRGPIIPQFPPQSLDLPSITISRNMMEQEGVSINNGQPVVSTAMHAHPQQIKRTYLLPARCSTLFPISYLLFQI